MLGSGKSLGTLVMPRLAEVRKGLPYATFRAVLAR
jgi:hypothetical protein